MHSNADNTKGTGAVRHLAGWCMMREEAADGADSRQPFPCKPHLLITKNAGPQVKAP